MKHYPFYIILIFIGIIPTRLLGQRDSLILYDPYTLTKTDIIVNYDINSSIEETNSSIGNLENKTDLNLTLPDSVRKRFTYNSLTSSMFDMLSYPIRTNIALHPKIFYGTTDHFKAAGSGILISPNAVLTAGHVIGYEANNVTLGIYFKWQDSLYVSPSLKDGYPQAKIGNIKVKKCYIFKRFVNSLGHEASDDLALLILDEPVGYKTGWIGMGYVSSNSFLLNNVFYNFSYPGMDGYDGLNMYYKYGQFSNVSYDLTSASNQIEGIPGESGSGFFYTDNFKYITYGIRTYASSYTLITKDKFRVFKTLVENNPVSSLTKLSKESDHLIIFPNPASEFISIKLKNTTDRILGLLIYNLQCQLFISRAEIGNGENIDISNLQSGLYIIEITTSKEKVIKKLIVK